MEFVIALAVIYKYNLNSRSVCDSEQIQENIKLVMIKTIVHDAKL